MWSKTRSSAPASPTSPSCSRGPCSTFAAQALAVLRGLGLPDDAEHVNPNGGAIALGHPLGMSGARLALSTALELADRGAARAVVTMCIGVGQGIAVLLEAP